jgi:SpoVK/Ycf46/Vps4 family AAA+-type ATPase
MRDDNLRPVVERLLATRRAKVEETQGGARRGMRVLFSGHSGRNRLLAAQLFARELAVDLYQVDLDRFVGKLADNTEKNLDAFFAAASASDAVLWFDDTDHLFGSHTGEESGRFPSLNVAGLRRRLENYDGVVVLGVEDRASVDPRIARQCDEVVELD